MNKMKRTNSGGFEMRTLDLQARDSRLTRAGHWLMDYSIEIISVIGLVLMAYLIGMLMQSVGQGVQAFSELIDEQQIAQEDAYQMNKVLTALVAQRANVDPTTGAELPPYWTAQENYWRAEVSAYTSSVDETDDTPFITASGARTGKGTLACPTRYEFGTKVSINGEIYTCEDRMNARYRDGDYFDIWMETKEEAFNWGRRNVLVKIIN